MLEGAGRLVLQAAQQRVTELGDLHQLDAGDDPEGAAQQDEEADADQRRGDPADCRRPGNPYEVLDPAVRIDQPHRPEGSPGGKRRGEPGREVAAQVVRPGGDEEPGHRGGADREERPRGLQLAAARRIGERQVDRDEHGDRGQQHREQHGGAEVEQHHRRDRRRGQRERIGEEVPVHVGKHQRQRELESPRPAPAAAA